jgi:hypothetical protein
MHVCFRRAVRTIYHIPFPCPANCASPHVVITCCVLCCCRLGYHPTYFVPLEQSVADVHNVQTKHVNNILSIIGGESARRLGFDHMSAERELKRWNTKYQSQWDTLENGLANKKQGLDHMRRTQLSSTRLYDIADYYYKARCTYASSCRSAHTALCCPPASLPYL